MKIAILIFLLISMLFSKESIQINNIVNKNDMSIMNAKAIMYLDQNIDDIYARITDFPNYHNHIDVISKSEIYHKSNNIISLKMTTDILAMFSLVNHFVHKINKDNYKITWELDDTKDNILNYAKGGWKLEKLSEHTTKVIYHNSIKTPLFMPSIISNYIMEEGVRDSTLWLMKKNSKTNVY